MKISELIVELGKYPDGIVDLYNAGGSMGSEETGWMPEDKECKGVQKTDSGILLTPY